MMLIGRYVALLDANVLHPAFVRGALLWLADEGLFQPRWSADIMLEWRRSVARRFPDIQGDWLDAKQGQMTEAFPSAEISDYEPFIQAVDLPDPDDRHVAAAAIMGRCNAIITANTKHFPAETLRSFQIEVVHPDDFIVNIIDLDQARALQACRRHRETLKNPRHTAAEFLERYRVAGLIQAHGRLAAHEGWL
jgi:predicted nucleic acid-binding protein